ncbi:MAG: cytochrome c biogenesis protein CcsA [Myxococcales bacterium]|nr:cytochrome c biogenesis protein CcsA [Myxococcales bacterium]
MNVSSALEIAQIGAYGLSSGLYLGFHLGAGGRVALWARRVFLVGFVVHLVDIGVRCFRLQHPLSSTAEAMAFVAWLVAAGFLLATLRSRLAAAGAFAGPTVLVLLVLARVLPDASRPGTPTGPLATAHIFLSTVGEALFALAAALAALYLIQERRLKRKDFARLRTTGAPLETLDRLAARCVSWGFPVFSLAIITGAVLVARLGLLQGEAVVRPEYVLAVASWVAYGVLIVARRGAGWQGRRAAWLTVGGFGGAVLVLVAYFVRNLA